MNKPNTIQSLGIGGVTAVTVVNFTHPIELIKTNIQAKGKDFSLKSLIKTEGLNSLYKGIKAAWVREITYTSVKLGGYGPIKKALGASERNSPLYLKFIAGASSGSIGTVIGNPFDVLKTQMMTANKEIELSKTIRKIYQSQGLSGFYCGIEANIARACILNGTKMSCYDEIKSIVVSNTGYTRKDPRCQFISATGAGFLMTCTTAPFDMIRTTLMYQPPDKKIYNGFFDCAKQLLKNNSPKAFYRGFIPMWARFAPMATLQLIIFEALLNVCGFDSI